MHYNIRATGKVQGVWFRDSTRRKALELGIAGFVCNEPDGSVYIEAEGEESDLKKLVEWCRKGPLNARVEKVDVTKEDMKGYEGFEISRSRL